MLPGFTYVRADSERRASEETRAPGSHLLAGGTDLLGCLRDDVFGAEKVVSLGALDPLRGLYETADGGLGIGALTTLAEIAASPLVEERFPSLAQAALAVASPQIRNQGTLGGNLCQRPRCWYFRGDFDCARKGGDVCYAVDGENRYHAILGGGPCHIVHPSDTAPALVALDATIHVSGPRGAWKLPLAEFFQLPDENLTGENVLEPGDVVTRVTLPAAKGRWLSSYRKVRERSAWDFALTSVALALRLEADHVAEARVVLGGVAPIPWRSKAAERILEGRPLGKAAAREAAREAARGAQPMSENRYKVQLVEGVVEESLLALSV